MTNKDNSKINSSKKSQEELEKLWVQEHADEYLSLLYATSAVEICTKIFNYYLAANKKSTHPMSQEEINAVQAGINSIWQEIQSKLKKIGSTI